MTVTNQAQNANTQDRQQTDFDFGPERPLSEEIRSVVNAQGFKRVLHAASKEEAYATHLQKSQKITEARAEIEGYLNQALRVNGSADTVTLERKVKRPDVRNAQVAKLLLEELKEILYRALALEAGDLFADLNALLEKMMQQRQVGLFEKESEDSCFYTYFEQRVEKTVTDGVEGGRRVRLHKETKILKKIYHNLINYNCHPMPADEVECPPRTDALLRNAPALLRPLMFVVEGTQISEQTAEQVVETKEWKEYLPVPVQRWDPGLVLLGYVLIGWDDREMEQIREQQRDQKRKERNEEVSYLFFLSSFAWLILALYLSWLSTAAVDRVYYEENAQFQAEMRTYKIAYQAWENRSFWEAFWGQKPEPTWPGLGRYFCMTVVFLGVVILAMGAGFVLIRRLLLRFCPEWDGKPVPGWDWIGSNTQ